MITTALYYSLMSGRAVPFALFFFLKFALANHVLLWFHIILGLFLYFLMKNTIGILIGSALDMYIALGNMYRCNILGAVHLFLEME